MTTARVLSLEQLEEIAGEECLTAMLSAFSCPLNKRVEEFIREKAIQSERLGSTVTYLAFSAKDEVLGFFTLVLKPFTVANAGLSSRNRNLIRRFSELDENLGTYTAALYLIAHLGKNFALDESRRISGSELLGLAFDVLRKARMLVGGKLVLIASPIGQSFLTFTGLMASSLGIVVIQGRMQWSMIRCSASLRMNPQQEVQERKTILTIQFKGISVMVAL